MTRPSLYTLRDLVEAVQAVATHDAEVVATVVSLINSGQVRLCGALAGATIGLASSPPAPRRRMRCVMRMLRPPVTPQ